MADHDSPQQRDEKAEALAVEAQEKAEVLIVERVELAALLAKERVALAAQLAKELRRFRTESYVLYGVSILLILIVAVVK